MKEETGPYWVEASVESEEMGEAVLDGMIACENLRMWALHEMTKRWSATQGSPTTSELAPAMTQYIREKGIEVQRYSLLAALNAAVTEFNREVRVMGTAENGAVHLVRFPTFEANSTLEIVFQSRFIWRKYIADYGRISTVYGSVFLEGDWPRSLKTQANELGASQEVFPYLIYAATLRNHEGDWLLRFNTHSPKSKAGKDRVRQRKAKEIWQ